jgi:hypothetical protein
MPLAAHAPRVSPGFFCAEETCGFPRGPLSLTTRRNALESVNGLNRPGKAGSTRCVFLAQQEQRSDYKQQYQAA